jgi:hypothetical protein
MHLDSNFMGESPEKIIAAEHREQPLGDSEQGMKVGDIK